MSTTKNIDEKQYLLRFKCDTKSHLTVIDDDICATKCPEKTLHRILPR